MLSRKYFIVLSKILFVGIIAFSTFFLGRYYQINQDKFSDDVRSMNEPEIPINELIKQAVEKGDTNSYHTLLIAYLDYPNEAFLPIALEMANKHNYPQAYFDVYSTLEGMENLTTDNSLKEWEKWNSGMKKMAFEYLLTGAKLGHQQSIETIRNNFLPNKKLHTCFYRHKDLTEKFADTLNKLQSIK